MFGESVEAVCMDGHRRSGKRSSEQKGDISGSDMIDDNDDDDNYGDIERRKKLVGSVQVVNIVGSPRVVCSSRLLDK